MPYLVQNEQAKLLANALDRASTTCLATGVLVPVTTFMLALKPAVDLKTLVVPVVTWLLATLALHIEAERVIRTLREEL
jgi:hypothetical protein